MCFTHSTTYQGKLLADAVPDDPKKLRQLRDAARTPEALQRAREINEKVVSALFNPTAN